jgi:hypothetical protein
VNVTLTALNGNFTPSERVLNLHPEHPSIQIGRASKSISKGLLGAADNAWFDSPVMSRDHAEMIFNSEDNVRYHDACSRGNRANYFLDYYYTGYRIHAWNLPQ